MHHRALVVVASTVLMCVQTFAQTSDASQSIEAWARIGASVGAPIPIGDVPDGAEGSPTLGLVAGGYFDVSLAESWSLLCELQFVHYGGSFSTPLKDQPYVDRIPITTPDGTQAILEVNTTFTGTATGEFSNNYIQLPLLAAWRAYETWRFIGGPYAGILLSTSSYAKGVGHVGIRPETVEKDMYFNEKIKGIDYGAVIGAQYSPLNDLSVDMRCALGFTSIFRDDFVTVDRTVQNVYIQASLAYRVF